MNLGILIFIIPLYSKDLGADKMTVGFITSAYAIAYTVSSPLWGKASDILGRKLALSLGMLGYSVAVLLLAFVSDPGQIIIVRLLGGLVDSSFWTVPTALIADLYSPQERGAILGTIGTFQLAGLITGPALGGALILGLKYPSVFYICSIFMFSIALLVFFGVKEKSKISKKETKGSSETRLKFRETAKKGFTVAYFNMAFSAMAFGVIVSQFIVHAGELLGPGKIYLVSFLLTSYLIAEAFIQPPAGKLSDIIGRYYTTLLAFTMCAIGFFILTFRLVNIVPLNRPCDRRVRSRNAVCCVDRIPHGFSPILSTGFGLRFSEHSMGSWLLCWSNGRRHSSDLFC